MKKIELKLKPYNDLKIKVLKNIPFDEFRSQMISQNIPSFVALGRSYNKIYMMEVECVKRIEVLHVALNKVGLDEKDLLLIHSKACRDYKGEQMRTDFLHLYEDYLKKAYKNATSIHSKLNMSVVDMINMEKNIERRDHYHNRDWIGISKRKKRK